MSSGLPQDLFCPRRPGADPGQLWELAIPHKKKAAAPLPPSPGGQPAGPWGRSHRGKTREAQPPPLLAEPGHSGHLWVGGGVTPPRWQGAAHPPPAVTPSQSPPLTFQASLQALNTPRHAEHQRLDLAPRLGDGQLEELQGRAPGRAPGLLPQLQRGLPLAQAQRGGPAAQRLPARARRG